MGRPTLYDLILSNEQSSAAVKSLNTTGVDVLDVIEREEREDAIQHTIAEMEQVSNQLAQASDAIVELSNRSLELQTLQEKDDVSNEELIIANEQLTIALYSLGFKKEDLNKYKLTTEAFEYKKDYLRISTESLGYLVANILPVILQLMYVFSDLIGKGLYLIVEKISSMFRKDIKEEANDVLRRNFVDVDVDKMPKNEPIIPREAKVEKVVEAEVVDPEDAPEPEPIELPVKDIPPKVLEEIEKKEQEENPNSVKQPSVKPVQNDNEIKEVKPPKRRYKFSIPNSFLITYFTNFFVNQGVQRGDSYACRSILLAPLESFQKFLNPEELWNFQISDGEFVQEFIKDPNTKHDLGRWLTFSKIAERTGWSGELTKDKSVIPIYITPGTGPEHETIDGVGLVAESFESDWSGTSVSREIPIVERKKYIAKLRIENIQEWINPNVIQGAGIEDVVKKYKRFADDTRKRLNYVSKELKNKAELLDKELMRVHKFDDPEIAQKLVAYLLKDTSAYIKVMQTITTHLIKDTNVHINEIKNFILGSLEVYAEDIRKARGGK